ncbi:SDR family oxidoreductase [Streptomyces mirabilis]|uniref:hypothetical protein n=1 Tax=Streptomyces mirabilis TaxID=68239 RepID=UPI0036B3F890
MSPRGERVVVVGGTAGVDLAVAEAAARERADAVVASRRWAAVDGALRRLPFHRAHHGHRGPASDAGHERGGRPVRGDGVPHPALALEPAPIRVNVVSPRVLRTELWRELPEADREDLFASAAHSLPVGRGGGP